jgi:hypothetical protein
MCRLTGCQINIAMVRFNFKTNQEKIISVDYKLFDFAHSHLWYDCVKDFVNSGLSLTDNDRIYNFGNQKDELLREIKKCNDTISIINDNYRLNIPFINSETFQSDVNYIHTYFVDNDRVNKENLQIWNNLNGQLHGIETIQRRFNETPSGQVFVRFENKLRFELPKEAYKHFTIAKNYGYLYAGYPHVGRHIFEMFLAGDEDAHDDHIVPQFEIAADSYMWFGKTSPDFYIKELNEGINDFFHKHNIGGKINKEISNPECAIGWLPVAYISNNIDPIELTNIVKIDSVELI